MLPYSVIQFSWKIICSKIYISHKVIENSSNVSKVKSSENIITLWVKQVKWDPPWHKNPLAIDYKILRVDEVSTRSSPVIVLSTEAVIFCGGECQPLIRTLTFKPFTLRQKLQSGALQSWLSSRVYQHVSLFIWLAHSMMKPVKQTLLLSMQTHVCVSVKSQIIMTPALVKLTAHNYPRLFGFIISFAHKNQQYTLVCQWETSTFVRLWIPASVNVWHRVWKANK